MPSQKRGSQGAQKSPGGDKEKALIRKTCKNCGEEFETTNIKKKTYS